MSATLPWREIVMRLALTLIAGALIGDNRSEHGKAVGMRTTVLVCLAASVAMIQVNLLLPMAGRAPNSFVMNDLMRFPLGILTGVGFIGAGVILRRDNIIIGVTTAATLWYVTVIGLCLGSGLLALGMVATLLGLCALWGLKWVEEGLRRERRARLSIELAEDGPSEAAIRRRLSDAGLRIAAGGFVLEIGDGRRKITFDLRELRRPSENDAPRIVDELAAEPGVARTRWEDLF